MCKYVNNLSVTSNVHIYQYFLMALFCNYTLDLINSNPLTTVFKWAFIAFIFVE